jgi:hypothetical protein
MTRAAGGGADRRWPAPLGDARPPGDLRAGDELLAEGGDSAAELFHCCRNNASHSARLRSSSVVAPLWSNSRVR